MRIVLLLMFASYCNAILAQTAKELNLEATEAYRKNDYKLTILLPQKALRSINAETKRNRKDYLNALRNLGYSEMSLGNYEKSLQYFQQFYSTSHQEKKNSIEYLESFPSMAKIYNALNKVDSAEFYYEAGIAEINKVINRNNRFYRNNILKHYEILVELKAAHATLSAQKGLTNKAISTIEPLIPEIEQLFPDEYESLYFYITLLNNLGSYYMEIDDFDKAEFYFEKHSNVVDDEGYPIDYLLSLSNRGIIYSKVGNQDSAISLFQQARKYGEEHNLHTRNEFKSALANLGNEYLNIEEYDQASFYLQKSLQLQKEQSSYNAYLYKATLFNLATAYNWQGKYDQASEVFNMLLSKINTDIQYNFTFLNENEKSAFFKTQQFYFENFTNYCFEASGFIPSIQYSSEHYSDLSLSKDLYNNRLYTKGLILNATAKMRYRLLNNSKDEERQLYQEWVNKKHALRSLTGASNVSLEAVEAAEKDLAFVENKLVEISESFKHGFLVKEVTWKDIQRQLKKGEAAVEIIRMLNGLGYLILILTPETVEMPAMTYILSKGGKFMEKEMFSYYKNSIKYQIEDKLSYSNYWAPIIGEIGKLMGSSQLEKLYVSADGIYHQININTLQNPETGKFVIDELEVHMLESTKQLTQNSLFSNREKTAVLIGNPAFTVNSESANEVYLPLLGTEEELEKVSSLLEAERYTVDVNKGREATEQKIREIKSPKIIHLATHGFFIDEQSSGEDDNLLIALLLNSGLALSGVNQRDERIRENGILRAYEATELNLDSTELVVLSACETGLGNYYPGQGVYGLQKAFFAAGTKNIIMSLWKVDDSATQKLMSYFYDFWLQGNSMSSAFRQAQVQLRKAYPEPYFWGAFVLNSN
ncbi:hypothetical protein C9994_00605 [Marivirga lumbricoides]|uniref:CHAT domain-containing protein n=1 Tax=Marivirga lumbricoides TaxID=1046115 RepID=A0A2T4DVX2_9BACT|nr:hypothetical protein C9994_00605 [Marivirga lumbricoides]